MPSAVSKAVFGGRYQASPVTLSDGSVGYVLLDAQGRIVTYIGRYQAAPATLADGDSSQPLLDSLSRLVALTGMYQASPTTLADLAYAPPLLDSEGRLITLISGVCPDGETRTVELAHNIPSAGTNAYALRTTHMAGLKSVSVCDPGVAYANGVNSLCLAAPSVETTELEIENIYLSSKAAGDFYICCRNLGIAPGATTNYTFDLVGILGDGITNTADVLWATFLGATGKGLTGGDFHFDIGPGCELYLIAPDITYDLVITWIEAEA